MILKKMITAASTEREIENTGVSDSNNTAKRTAVINTDVITLVFILIY